MEALMNILRPSLLVVICFAGRTNVIDVSIAALDFLGGICLVYIFLKVFLDVPSLYVINDLSNLTYLERLNFYLVVTDIFWFISMI